MCPLNTASFLRRRVHGLELGNRQSRSVSRFLVRQRWGRGIPNLVTFARLPGPKFESLDYCVYIYNRWLKNYRLFVCLSILYILSICLRLLGKSFWKSPWCHGQKFQNLGELSRFSIWEVCKVQQVLGEAADVGWSTSCSLPIGPEDTPWVFRSKIFQNGEENGDEPLGVQ